MGGQGTRGDMGNNGGMIGEDGQNLRCPFVPDDLDGDVMHTLKGVNIIHGTIIDRLIDKQRGKEATMQPHDHGRVLFSSTQPQLSTLHEECLFLCLVFGHFPQYPIRPPFPSPHRPITEPPLPTPIPPLFAPISPKVAHFGDNVPVKSEMGIFTALH